MAPAHKAPAALRDDFLKSTQHMRSIVNTIQGNIGRGRIFQGADVHKIYSGLLLNAWTGFEYATRGAFIYDVSLNKNHPLLTEIRSFKSKHGAYRAIELYFTHADRKKFYEWGYEIISERAKQHLPINHRFVKLSNSNEMLVIKRLRNAVSHGSDKAHADFMNAMSSAPISLTPSQRKGITPERFLASRKWNGNLGILKVLDELDSAIRQIIP